VIPSADDVADGGAMSTTAGGKKQRKKRMRKHHHLPRFPYMPDSVVGTGHVNERKVFCLFAFYVVYSTLLVQEHLEAWLLAVLHIPVNRNHHETVSFFVSRLSNI
jgi:hypothetical protein